MNKEFDVNKKEINVNNKETINEVIVNIKPKNESLNK